MHQFLKHLFIPHNTNNFRPKLLHNSSIFVIILLLLAGTILVRGFQNISPDILGISYSITESDLFTQTNKARTDQGLAPLSQNAALSLAAKKKLQYMFEKNFWAHFAPDGTSPWSFIKSSGYSYSYAGENLAKGFTNSQDIINAWLASPSHRENLLSANYREIGFAIQEGNLQGEDTVMVVQMFGSQPGTAAVPQKIASAPKPKVQSLAVAPVVRKQKVVASPVVNSASVTKTVAIGALTLFLILLVVDIIIVNKRKIPRIVGHNLDHIILLAIFLLFLLLEVKGGTL